MMLIRTTYILLLCLLSTALTAQEFVLPGDANNSGLVDHYDIVPVGYAYGQLGPIRHGSNHTDPQEIVEPWDRFFPNGVNYTYADANGNGHVELLDFTLVSQNIGLEAEDVTPLQFLQGNPDTDPNLLFNDNNPVPYSAQNTTIAVPLHLTVPVGMVAVNGLAFDIEFNPAYIEDISLEFSSEWINADGASFQYQRTEVDKMHVAVTRFGEDPVSGAGVMGTMNLVIIEDLIDLFEGSQDTSLALLRITNVFGVNDDYTTLPIATGELLLTWNRVALTTNANQLYPSHMLKMSPNPTRGQLALEAKFDVEEIILYSIGGRTFQLYDGAPRRQWTGYLPNIPSGYYFIQLRGPDGHITQTLCYQSVP